MEFEYIKEDKLLIVKIIAEIDHHTTEKLRRKIDNEITRYMPRKVIFNFDKVFISTNSPPLLNIIT